MPNTPAAARPSGDSAGVATDAFLDSLAARLLAVRPHLSARSDDRGSVSANAAGAPGPGALAESILRDVSASEGLILDRDVWLVIVAFTAVYPTPDEHRAVRRALGLGSETGRGGSLPALLEALEPIIRRSFHLDDPIEVVANAVVLDADFSGRSDHNTGVQRVLRETASRWSAVHELTLVCWNDDNSGMRRLGPTESRRVTDWAGHSTQGSDARRAAEAATTAARPTLVPVDSVIVEIEVAQQPVAAALAGLAGVSGNPLVMVGHDAIPIVSADSQDAPEIERFARYLTVVKNASRVAGVSESAAGEFSGFVSALRAQGITGPEVVAVPLAMNPPTSRPVTRVASRPVDDQRNDTDALPLILVVGSQEPRKNHDAILFAAERLWAEGVAFRLRFIGGGSAATIHRFDGQIHRLRATGAPVEVLRGASDAVLLNSYREARFTVFPSLHEGFGLPVAESLALGTPVITADHGSLREAAEGGGCLLVDARDDEQLRTAMASLLLDDELYQRLRQEAAERSFRSWDDYAGELWAELVVPAQRELALRAAQGQSRRGGHADTGAAPSAGALAATLPSEDILAAWWVAVAAAEQRREAWRNSMVGKISRVGPLVHFFVVRSREMGVIPASKSALRIVRRRLSR
ncbi:glycosyltransferase family 4 protein [Subtercola sp. PAMC28395]|uniref:glycosyltransferase family 4 protein n=1 Tax=Subtercola sp. PAMC28395 TaxID=2846775 RepID=UPI001C0CE3AE|nr:glycosyltransferase family 1 protein [Subtercola sp. PAMC28395]QWT25034.1 glycosyltransferase family 4 protein [Subtercola sp. PAMC28395]